MRICCIDREKLPQKWISTTGVWRDDFFAEVEENDVSWIERADVEADEYYRQIIPYILIVNSRGEYLCYLRHGAEQRLAGLYSFGLGGHIDYSDKQSQLSQTIEVGLLRELSEELANFERDALDIEYKGIINEIVSEVGRVHIGLVYIAQCKENYLPVPAEETRGAKWINRTHIDIIDKELWSVLAFQLIDNEKKY